MKKFTGGIAFFLGICLAFGLPGLILGVAFNALSEDHIQMFQFLIWGFAISFVLYLFSGGKAEDFMFWKKKDHQD